jgi:putative heme-binding domain-containing protein
MAFDPATGSLWTGDVGWEMMEMVYRIDRGANYGWSLMEGSQVVKENGARTSTPITPPIVEHTHLEARSVTGGYFWNADRLPELAGAYIYGDWMTGKIWGLRHDGSQVTWHQEVADTNLQIICFALQDDGEVLVVGYDGTVHRLIPNLQQAAAADFPRRLSETGLFASTPDQVPAVGVIPYEINAQHWADHTESQRWIAIPGDGKLGVFDKSDWQTGQVKGHFIFPHDTVLAKTVFYRRDVDDPKSRQRLETQLLHRNGDDWNAYNYIWNEDQTDAVLQQNVASDREITVVDPSQPSGLRKQTWHHVSRNECLLCHIWSASTVHGFKLDQLNRPASQGGGNQLDRLADLGIFAGQVPKVAPIASPTDQRATLEARARSYLHMNCAHCHRRGGGGTAAFELVGDVPLENLDLVDARPTQGSFGLTDPRVVAAGDPYRSVLLYRLVKSGRGHMPQFGPSLIDDKGVMLIHDWIASLDPGLPTTSKNVLPRVPLQTALRIPETVAKVNSMLDSTCTALQLAIACCDPKMTEQQRSVVADIASQHADSTVRDLFERFLPEERRVKRLGTSIDAKALLAIRGDVDAGRDQYFGSADVSCRQCHRIGDQGVAVGPDLSSIGIQRTPAEILDSILHPSAKIDPKYQGKLVLTVDGAVVSGLVVSENDQSITVVEASGKARKIPRDEIETVKPLQKSVMPDLMFAEFTAQQAADLLAFLVDQKKPVITAK